MPDQMLEPERLKAIVSEMVEALTSPPYVEAMRVLKSTKNENRLGEALNRLTPEALRAQGVKLPADMRISSRYFEPAFRTTVELGDYGAERNYLKQMYEADPGLIDRISALRDKSPELYRNVTERLTVGDISPLAACACACGGGATICGGAGGG